MTGVMSLWSRPHLERFGKYSEQFMMLWGYSFAEARKVFKELILLTDVAGAEIMKTFPYDRVEIILEEDFLPPEPRKVWSAGKLVAFLWCAQNGIEFCHFDGDAVIRKPLHIFGSQVFAQSDETFPANPTTDWMREPRHHILTGVYINNGCSKLPYLPEYVKFSLTRDVHVPYNTGIFGGNNLDFIEQYAKDALATLRHPSNLTKWKDIHAVCTACFIEQYIMGSYAQNQGQYVTILFPDSANLCEDYMRAVGYTHLLGDSKRDSYLMDRVYGVMQEDHPQTFEDVKRMGLPLVAPFVGNFGEGSYPS